MPVLLFWIPAAAWLGCTPEPLDSGVVCQPLTGTVVDDSPDAPSPLANVPLFAESLSAPGTPLLSVSDAEGAFTLDLAPGPWALWGEESPGCPGQRLELEVACQNGPVTLVVVLCG